MSVAQDCKNSARTIYQEQLFQQWL